MLGYYGQQAKPKTTKNSLIISQKGISKMNELFKLTPVQNEMFAKLQKCVFEARWISDRLSEQEEDRIEILDDDGRVMYEGDRQTEQMLRGAIQGYYNELVHPLMEQKDERGRIIFIKTTDEAMKTIVDPIVGQPTKKRSA